LLTSGLNINSVSASTCKIGRKISTRGKFHWDGRRIVRISCDSGAFDVSRRQSYVHAQIGRCTRSPCALGRICIHCEATVAATSRSEIKMDSLAVISLGRQAVQLHCRSSVSSLALSLSRLSIFHTHTHTHTHTTI